MLERLALPLLARHAFMLTTPLDPSAALQVASQAPLSADQQAALRASTFGPFECRLIDASVEALAPLASPPLDAVLVAGEATIIEAAARKLGQQAALLVVAPAPVAAAQAIEWFKRGVQDVMTFDDLAAPGFAQRLRAAIERHRREREARTAYATDIDTGLPHQQQLIEHMSQLLALREREPAPMALLVFRIEGFASAEARHGADAVAVLRRKVGVRLRAGVRASDVVAALNDDAYAVLLGALLSPDDAQRVGAKLVASLATTFRVGMDDISIAVALGIGQYPDDGTQPDMLLRQAMNQAQAQQAAGRAGFSNFAESSNSGPSAANDT